MNNREYTESLQRETFIKLAEDASTRTINAFTSSVEFGRKVSSTIKQTFDYTTFEYLFSRWSNTIAGETFVDNALYRYFDRNKDVRKSITNAMDNWVKQQTPVIKQMVQQQVTELEHNNALVSRFNDRMTSLEVQNVSLIRWNWFYFLAIITGAIGLFWMRRANRVF